MSAAASGDSCEPGSGHGPPRKAGASPALDRIPAPALFLASGVSMYYGAALAVALFALASAVSVGWARLVVAAVVLVVWARPWRQRWTSRALGAAAVFGLFLGGMNLLFYLAIDRIPLGAAVAIEFTGPVAVAVLADRSGWGWRRMVAPVLAAGGVAAISAGEVEWTDLGTGGGAGVLLALAAGAAWAGYMVVGRRIAAAASLGSNAGLPSLAIGMTTAALAFAVVGAPGSGPLLSSWVAAALVVGVGVLSSVVPYALDQVAMRRLSTSAFALLNALLPATAVVVGALALRQIPSVWELVGVAAISAAVALASRAGGSGS